MEEIKLRILEISIMLVKEAMVTNDVIDTYLELREEILGIPREPKEEEQKENKIVCHIFSV